ncbi:MAG: Gldg family protein, partial [Pirellulaceae bacterium]
MSFATLLLMDLMFLVVVGVPIYLLARRKRAAFAVLKRNFLGYFSNPTGYVFLCLFVLLTSMAAFWPHEFFSSNLATLGQLNKWFPIIMLFFIPAITMSIWAEERRQGTDELLLTLPADDFDIVIGKYLSAGAIYTASLLFSQISTFLVLVFLTLGNVDTGLFFANYLGYWCIGMAMIAIGMIASFLTNNLTVGFILGALFNAPLAFASMSDVIAPNRAITRMIKGFSITERFDDFGRGVISLSSLAYFILLAMVGLYLCMVLIGRRHWSGGKEGNTMFLHYFTRILLLGAIAVLGSFFFRNNDQRQDVTVGRVSSISPTTREMIRGLKPERPIVVDAYLSGEVPEAYSKTKYELISMLKEFESVAKANKVPLEVRINDNLESISEEAKLAEEQYGITPNRIRVRERGTMSDQNVILGVAFRSGLEKVVVPFFGSGVPVEYELIRSLNTVSKPSRKKLGVLKTDAQMAGGFSMANFQQLPKQAIINELSKQYEIVDIDPTSAIAAGQCDVLLAVQPSSLSPEQM